MHCEEKFFETYHRDPVEVAFCPYRICPMGAHSDHQFGKITGLAIDKGVRIAYGPKKNGVVEMASLQFPKRAQWHIRQVDEHPVGDWADYLRGATWALAKHYELRVGICGVVEGTLPIGGLSSSAAVIIAFLSAPSKVNGIRLEGPEMIQIALEAERDYVGVSVGTLDQSCEVYSRRNHLLYLDTQDGSYELIPQHPDMKPYKIAIMFSGIERTLVGSKFNMRVDEAKSAAYAMKAYAGLEYGKFNDTRLRDIPVAIYNEYKDRLPENWHKRAEHYFTEFDRVQRGAEAWRVPRDAARRPVRRPLGLRHAVLRVRVPRVRGGPRGHGPDGAMARTRARIRGRGAVLARRGGGRAGRRPLRTGPHVRYRSVDFRHIKVSTFLLTNT
jgi:galactokinase/galacturonokinase